MSTRPFLKPFSVITAQSMAADVTSSATIINEIPMVSYHVSFTGTPTGTFSVQVSDDYSINVDGSVRNAGTWNTLPLSATCAASGAADNGFIDISNTGTYAIRLIYTRTSGTGTLNALICGKVT